MSGPAIDIVQSVSIIILAISHIIHITWGGHRLESDRHRRGNRHHLPDVSARGIHMGEGGWGQR